jgi:hypothetical protein
MSISGNYPQPVTVNGFTCKNCTDVDYANKHIDPAHPKSGPYGINAKSDPSVKPDTFIKFGGKLAGGSQASSVPSLAPQAPATQTVAAGQSVNILA